MEQLADHSPDVYLNVKRLCIANIRTIYQLTYFLRKKKQWINNNFKSIVPKVACKATDYNVRAIQHLAAIFPLLASKANDFANI